MHHRRTRRRSSTAALRQGVCLLLGGLLLLLSSFAEAGKPSRKPRLLWQRLSVKGALSVGQIERVLQKQYNALLGCYRKVLKRKPNAKGFVDLRWLLMPTGRVSHAHVRKATLQVKGFGLCLCRVLRRGRYPQPKGGGIVLAFYRFVFSPPPAKIFRRLRPLGRLPTARVGRGSLTREEILRVVRRGAPGLRRCYQRTLHPGMPMVGKVLMSWVVQADGSTHRVRVQRSNLSHPKFHRCLVREIQGWTFPKPVGGGIVRVRFPFVFRR